MEVVAEFCEAAHHCFPNCLIQFEDFQTSQAFDILDKMRNKYLCFNDDIQGTGGVVTAGWASLPSLCSYCFHHCALLVITM